MHEARLQALMELTGALLETFRGDVDKAATVAENWLRRVSPPELDLTGLTVQEAGLVQRLPAHVWRILQRYAQASNEAGITSVSLSSKVNINATLVNGLAQLHVQHLALGYPVEGMPKVRLETLPFLEHLCQRSAAEHPPQYADLLQQPPVPAAEHTARFANVPPRTVRKMRDHTKTTVAPNDRMLQTSLNQAMEAGDSNATREHLGAIFKAKLGPRLTLQLLMSRVTPDPSMAQKPAKDWGPKPSPQDAPRQVGFPPVKIFRPELSAFVDDLDEQPQAPEQTATPLLAHLCGGPRMAKGRLGVIGAYLDEILKAETLSLHDKGTLCASTVSTPQGPLTAAQLAMNQGHPFAVSTMMLSILECDMTPAEKRELLVTLAVSQEEVDAVLSTPELQGISFVVEARKLLKDCWDALPLMDGDARVTLKSNTGPMPPILHVEKMYAKGTGQLLCSARQAIPELDGGGVSNRYLAGTGRFWYVVDPGQLVKHTPATPAAQESHERAAP